MILDGNQDVHERIENTRNDKYVHNNNFSNINNNNSI